jgi:MoxR-like ATPase
VTGVQTCALPIWRGDPLHTLTSVASAAELQALQQAADQVTIAREVADYAVRLANETRTHSEIERGVSTRAVLALVSAARAWALWDARSFVTPGDVRAVLKATLSHRLVLKTSLHGAFSREEAGHLVEELARRVPAPR